MIFSAIKTYIYTTLTFVPRIHWILILIISLAWTVYLISQGKYSTYGCCVLGITVLISLLFIETAIVVRTFDSFGQISGFDFVGEWKRLIHGNKWVWIHFIANIIVFIPFGFFKSEFLSTTSQYSTGRQIAYVAISGFGLSLWIECIQLVFRLGLFELTDLVMNTLGAFVGAGVAVLIRRVLHSQKLGRNAK